MVIGKAKHNKGDLAGIYDTSICQVKFRNPRILMKRKRTFDQDRDLSFDHNRRIDVRLQGILFRKTKAIGFRNIGVSNLEDIDKSEDWPTVEPAKSPESMVMDRDSDWEHTWGMDQTYEEIWGTGRDMEHDAILFPTDRLEPQLTYYSKQKLVKDDDPISRRSSKRRNKAKAKKKIGQTNTARKMPFLDYVEDQDSSIRTKNPVYQVAEEDSEPINSPPSSKDVRLWSEDESSNISSEQVPVSPKDRKRAYAFNEYGLSLMESGQYDRAMSYFQKAKGLDPNERTYTTNQKRCQQWMDYHSRKGV